MESMSYSSNSSFAPQSYIPFPTSSNHTLMAPSRSFSPEFHYADSPTYSFASSSNASKIQDEKCAPMYAPSMYNTLGKQEILSPLPDSFYDAYQGGGGMPLLTPPADPFYPSATHSQQEYRALPPPPVHYPIDYYFESNTSSPMPMQPCYTPGCQCQLPTPPAIQSPPQPSFYSMPSAGFYDPSSYAHHNTSATGSSKRQYKSRNSIDSTLSHEKSANTPRRYKCTLCVKRFTRPSSLATHMHSHTGEKPYKCAVDGCGRRFSVVSNLRRHAKIHSSAAP
ncbi:hypothetical protein MAM1_0140d06392 [Mucor ambiguus]|uniref:C2H2-type domain-containing protein n=1 Tax=Mucor ambiguus TaxID=91626 RepID=A0A0C9MU12_9FUNG|nr:hypothetical protein MAM1_0140d06392 [Mucor ambiguus]